MLTLCFYCDKWNYAAKDVIGSQEVVQTSITDTSNERVSPGETTKYKLIRIEL